MSVKAYYNLQFVSFHYIFVISGALLNISVGGKNLKIDFDKEFERLFKQRQRRNPVRYDSDGSDISLSSTDGETSDGIDRLINFLVDQSKLEPFIQIRERSIGITDQLKRDLCQLVRETTLDPEQLKSFIESLVEPVHLTQGPPGTGKSYLGVVIVRALIMIRDAWMKASPSISGMPILVLSYKNHAIDEFLVDLIKAERALSLLRIGGSSSDPSLSPYLEQNQRSYQDDTRKYKNTLTSLFQQKTNYQQMRIALSPLSAHQALKDSQPTSKEDAADQKQASYNAAQYLCDIIVRVQKIETFLKKEEEQAQHSDTDSDDSGYSECDISILWNELFSNRNHSIFSGNRLKLEINDIEKLSERVAHYNLAVQEILYQWIIGTKPLPKCSDLECKMNVKSNGYLYCDNHNCVYQVNGICNNPRLPDGHILCRQHACNSEQGDQCLAVKLDDPQIYCDDHACFVCIRNKVVAKHAEDEPPRNTCSDHPLCAAMIEESSCLIEVVSGTPFCKEHAFAICNHGDGSSKKCTKYVASRGVPYCEEHKPKPKPKEPPKVFKKCQSKNKKGKACKGKILHGHPYCNDHVHKATPKATEEDSPNHSWDTTQHDQENEVSSIKVDQSVEANKTVVKSLDDSEEGNDPEKIKDSSRGSMSLGNEGIQEQEMKNLVEDEEHDEFHDAYSDDPPLPDEEVNRPDDDDDLYAEDQYEHINDVYGIEKPEDLGGAEKFEDEENEEDEKLEATGGEEGSSQEETVKLISVSEWSWELSTEERLTQASLLEKKYKDLLAIINQKRNRDIDLAREEYHKAKVRAKSSVYEEQTVIGGTIVGCIGRFVR